MTNTLPKKSARRLGIVMRDVAGEQPRVSTKEFLRGAVKTSRRLSLVSILASSYREGPEERRECYGEIIEFKKTHLLEV